MNKGREDLPSSASTRAWSISQGASCRRGSSLSDNAGTRLHGMKTKSDASSIAQHEIRMRTVIQCLTLTPLLRHLSALCEVACAELGEYLLG